MDWLYLILAGTMEIGWPVGFKLSQSLEHRVLGITLSIVCMGLSGLFLWLAQRQIPIGTAYAVWTGIGAAGTFIIGVIFFKDPASLARFISAVLIIAGVIGLRLTYFPQ